MIYIIGSGFSGLATAFVLIKKYKNITVISPSKSNVDNKSLTLMKYLLNLYGEIKFNSKRVSKKIESFEKNNYKNCKFITSYQDGGLSNIWGGVLSNVYKYNLKNFPIKINKMKKIKKEFMNLEKIIFKKNFKQKGTIEDIDKNLSLINFNKKNKNVNNLKKYLLTKNVNFEYNLYLKKIQYKNKKIIFYDLSNNKEKILSYKKLYIAAGPINTAKIILNSFKHFKSIKLYETRHFLCLVKKNLKSKNFKYFNFQNKKINFYAQLYNLKDIVNLFINFKNLNFFKNFYIAQCYLERKNSGHIEIKKLEIQVSLLLERI